MLRFYTTSFIQVADNQDGATCTLRDPSIVDFAKNTLNIAKDKGLSALGATSDFLHIQDGLEAVSKSLGKAAVRMEHLEQFHLDRVESKLLSDFELPSDFSVLPQDELKVLYEKLLIIGMDGDLTATENAIVQDMVEEVELLLPERDETVAEQEIEIESEQDTEI